MKTLIRTCAAILGTILLANCAAESPGLTGSPRPAPAAIPKKPDAKPYSWSFDIDNSEMTAKQDKYSNNEVSVLFRVANNDGKSVDKLKAADFKVLENNVPVDKFTIKADEQKSYQVVDIVFAVDITGSMGPFITYAKQRLVEFIKKTHPEYHIRMCLSTFGDFVVQKCDTFYDNSSASQVKSFNNALYNLSIKKGQGEYAGELDWEENPMRALTEATKAPWAQDSQRFVILVSDADFYSPDKKNKHFDAHQARPETVAPSMKEVNQAIKDSGVKVFLVTPPADGYNAPLNGEADITASSQGEWFEFKKVISKEIKLDAIFDKILQRINTTYKLTYVVEQNQGLNATLPVDKRDVKISTAKGAVSRDSITSSVPTGRPEYKKTWKVGEDAIRPDSANVWVNGKGLKSGEFSVHGNEVTLAQVPPAGAQLRITYFKADGEKNLLMEPMIVKGTLVAANTKVWLNGQAARAEDFSLEQDIDGDTSVKLAPGVFGSNDPYKIYQNQGLNVRLEYQP